MQPEVKNNGNKVTCKDIHTEITDENSFKVPMEIHKKKNTCSKFYCDNLGKKFTTMITLNHCKDKSHKVEFQYDVWDFKARKIWFLNLHTVAKYTNMSKVKGMGIKRDASVNTTKPEKKSLCFCVPY